MSLKYKGMLSKDCNKLVSQGHSILFVYRILFLSKIENNCKNPSDISDIMSKTYFIGEFFSLNVDASFGVKKLTCGVSKLY